MGIVSLADRLPFLEIVEGYRRTAPKEESLVIRELEKYVLHHENCFDRVPEEDAKHISASVVLLTQDLQKALFLWNKKLGCWASPGGHADGNADIHEVARQELRQETGVIIASFLFPDPLNISRYDFPPSVFGYTKSMYDVSFLAVLPAGQEPKIVEPEKHGEMRWVTPLEARALNDIGNIPGQEQLIRKWGAAAAKMVSINTRTEAGT